MDLREQLQRTLGSSYTLERELGGGGMARVFVATETRLRRTVVVKVLPPELAAELSVERFEREIHLAASLQQANIVPVLSAGEMDGVPYYTMPYVDGESLRALLTTGGPRPIAEAVSILHDVARALSYAHARGVVHRDIKPDNVLLSHGAAVVTDFGIAKAISASRTAAREVSGQPTLTQVGASIGTPAYMAPEQAAGDTAIDHRADIYAFGCLAYELLTGDPPFAGRSPQAAIAAHLTETPVPVGELRAETPPALASLVTRCLAKRAADRPASATELLESLAATATPIVADPRAVRQGRESWLRRVAPAIVIVVCLLLIVGLIVWSRDRNQGSPPATPMDRSIAVLPLANLSRDPRNDYLGDAIADEITGALVKAGLVVKGRTSGRSLAGRGLDPQEIGKQLHVASVLGGGVQLNGDRLHAIVSLTSVADGTVLWSESFERGVQEEFALQDEIARRVASQLRITLARGSATTLVQRKTRDDEALRLYQQGVWELKKRTAPAVRQAISLLDAAVSRDSNYGSAQAALAMAYVVLPVYDDVSADSMTANAVRAANRALTIDNTLPEAHAVLGYAHAATFENAPAESSFVMALSLDSGSAQTRFWHALLLSHIGRVDEAIRESQHAVRDDPANLVILNGQALFLYSAGRYAAADSAALAVLKLDAAFPQALLTRGAILIELQRSDTAITTLERLSHEPNLRSTEKVGMLAYAYARAGRRSEARATLGRIPQGSTTAAAGMVAAALDALGDRDSAVAVFRRAVAQHDPWLLSTGRSAPYDGLRKDPRLKSLFARIEAAN
jgi:eukaryotic-like serine/threonine-protein kinase